MLTFFKKREDEFLNLKEEFENVYFTKEIIDPITLMSLSRTQAKLNFFNKGNINSKS